MSSNDGLHALGLTSEASEEQVHERFKELARKHHPDVGGNPETMTSLTAAYQDALQVVNRRQLVPASTVKDLIAIVEKTHEKQQEAERLARADKVVGNVINHRTSPYRVKKQRAAVLGTASAALALLSNDVIEGFGTLFSILSDTAVPAVIPASLALLSFVCGVLYLILDNEAKREERRINDFSEAINSQFTTALFLNATIPDLMEELATKKGGRTMVNRNHIEHYVRGWLQTPEGAGLQQRMSASIEELAHRLHPSDLVDVLLAKAVAFGIFKHKQAFTSEGFLTDLYGRPRVEAHDISTNDETDGGGHRAP